VQWRAIAVRINYQKQLADSAWLPSTADMLASGYRVGKCAKRFAAAHLVVLEHLLKISLTLE
jgi:hypothetical protein